MKKKIQPQTISRLLSFVLVGILVQCVLTPAPLQAQLVAPGAGEPVGLRGAGVRSAITLPTLRIARVDNDSVRAAIDARASRTRLVEFAHKLFVDEDIIAKGEHFTTNDGKEVWLYRVRSAGALNLNFLFDKFHLPQGGLLYIYAPDGSRMIGAFGAENNNDAQILPTRPIGGDDVIIECQVPQGAERPLLHLSEVNHGVRSDFRIPGEPYFDHSRNLKMSCAPQVVCMPEFDELARSVVLIVTNGTAMGSGTLVNNLNNDGAPYLLTASHVVTQNCRYSDHERSANSFVVFFNYNASTCSGEVRAQTEQTLAGSDLIGIDITMDACLVRLHHKPPRDYNPYLAGWSRSDRPKGPYVNIHHPLVLMKRVNISNKQVTPGTFTYTDCPFRKDVYWKTQGWDIGSTEQGSSGSPLFDRDKRIIGALTSGESYCSTPQNPDVFYCFYKLWDSPNDGAKKITEALDPSHLGSPTCDGRPLYEETSQIIRLSHVPNRILRDSVASSINPLSREELIGKATGATAIAETYQLPAHSKIYGVYSTFYFEQVGRVSYPPIEFFIADEEGNTLASGDISFDRLPVYDTSYKETVNQERTISKLTEIYTPLDQPVETTKQGKIYFGYKVGSIHNNILPVVQSVNNKNSSVERLIAGKWSELEAKGNGVIMWMDPLVSSNEVIEYDEKAFFFVIDNHSAKFLFIKIPEYKEGQHYTLTVYDLLGRTLLQKTLTSTDYTIDRGLFEGMGVLLFTVRNDHETFTRRVYIASE